MAQEASGPNWDLKLGFSYTATGGNTETSSAGFDAGYLRQGRKWSFEGSSNAVSVTKRGRRTAESYNLLGRLKRKLRKKLQLTAGLRGERNRFAGIDSRALADVSLQWPLAEAAAWKLGLLAGLSLSREEPRGERPATEAFGGLVQLNGDGKLSETATWDGQLTFFPSFDDLEDYRLNGRLGLQAALNRHFGVRLGYDLKFDNEPVPGFETMDTTTTASLVLQLGRKK
jgi:putative salt-induced outer membrane protein